MDLEALVDRFLKDRPSCFRDECCEDFEFPKMHTLEDAIRIACRSVDVNGKLHSHQYRVPRSARPELERLLLEDKDNLSAAKSFDDLHSLVSRHCDKVKGAGALYAYDVALRIAEGFLKLDPEYVYLHAGAAEGARYLGVRGAKHRLTAFPKAMHRLSPAQAEDFLCICKDRLAQYRAASQ